MKPRAEYEKILDRTFVQSGEEGLERTRIDLLLDIRELLMWIQEDIIYQRAIKERRAITTLRENVFVDVVNDV